jgi:hypothetical protein
MLFNKKKVYILNGYAPDKLYIFNTVKCKTYTPILLDSKGDPTNAKNLYNIRIKDLLKDKNSYVLITSEEQLNYIAQSNSDLTYYNNHKSQFINVKFTDDSPINKLTSKLKFYTKMSKYTPYVEYKTGSEIKRLPKDLVIDHIVKSEFGSGSGGVIAFNSDNYKANLKKLIDDNTYIIEPIYLGPKYVHLWTDALITKNNLSYVTFRCDSFVDTVSTSPYWNPIYCTTEFDYMIGEYLRDFIKTFNVESGIIEPEFVYDYNSYRLLLIDHNPRWSAGTSYGVHTIAKPYLPKGFNILDYYFKDKPFNVNLPEGVVPEKYYYGTTYVPIKGA